MNYGSLVTNVYTRKKVGLITQHQSRLSHTNDVITDVILANHRVYYDDVNAEEYIFGHTNLEIPISLPQLTVLNPLS